jgi:hypothetical protein
MSWEVLIDTILSTEMTPAEEILTPIMEQQNVYKYISTIMERMQLAVAQDIQTEAEEGNDKKL